MLSHSLACRFQHSSEQDRVERYPMQVVLSAGTEEEQRLPQSSRSLEILRLGQGQPD